MRKSAPLQHGDLIGIAAPASPFDMKAFQEGIATLEAMGFRTRYSDGIFEKEAYLAGTDRRRAQEFMQLIRDDAVKAILFARGGYGSQRILPLLDLKSIQAHPKVIIGSSDLTALLTYVRQETGLPTCYGPVVTQLAHRENERMLHALKEAFTSPDTLSMPPLPDIKTLRAGTARGPIVGGCLSLIVSGIGTPAELCTEDAILFIEDRGEKVYALDRMLTQLKQSGKLDNVQGMIIGSLILPSGEVHDVEAMLLDLFREFSGPIISGFPAGHLADVITLPLGRVAELDAPSEGRASLNFLEGIFS